MIVPEIETERLRLRAHRLEDFADSFAMWANPIVRRFTGGVPSTEQQAWARVVQYVGQWQFLEYGYWVVEEKASRRFAGEVGFADFKRDIGPSMRGVPEIGWSFDTPFSGRGYATEAACAAVRWLDENRAMPRTVCLIDAENAASIRVAEKCGYATFQRDAFNGRAALFFERNLGRRALRQ